MALVALAIVTLRGAAAVLLLATAAGAENPGSVALWPWLIVMAVLDTVRVPIRVLGLVNTVRATHEARLEAVATLRWGWRTSSLPEVYVAGALGKNASAILDLVLTMASSVWHILGLIWLSTLPSSSLVRPVPLFAAVCISLACARLTVACVSSAARVLASRCAVPPPGSPAAGVPQPAWVTDVQTEWADLAVDSWGITMFTQPMSSLPSSKAPGLTPEQLKTLRAVAASECSQAASRCSICLTAFSPDELCLEIKPCGHCSFHQECVSEWLERAGNCPICRAIVEVPRKSETPCAVCIESP